MAIFMRSLARLLIAALIALVLPAVPAKAAIVGKTQLLPASYPIDNSGVVSSVGVYKKNPSGRVGVPAAFVPYYFLAQNKGTAGNLVTTNYYATLGYNVKGPDGKEISLSSYTQDVVGAGLITQSPVLRVIQSESTNGAAIFFVPQTTGTYTALVWHDFNEDGKLSNGEPSASATFVISAESALTVSYQNYGNAVGGLTDGGYGSLAKVCITNYSQIAGLQDTEGFTVTTSSGTEIFDLVSKWVNGSFGMFDNANSLSYTLTSENFGVNGCAYLNHYNSAPSPPSVFLTFTGFGLGLAGTSFTIASSYISTDAGAFPITSNANRVVTNVNNLVGSYVEPNAATASNANDPGTNFEIGQPIGVTTNVTISTTIDAGKSILFRVVDTDGKITGLKGAIFTGASASSGTSVTFAQSALLDFNESYLIYVQGTKALDATNPNATGTVAVKVKSQSRFAKYVFGYPPVIRGKVGGSTTAYLQLKDQFGVLLPKGIIIPAVSGRNATENDFRAYQADEYGRILWTIKDVPSNPTFFTDTVTGRDINGNPLVGPGLIVNYGPYQPVASVKITGAASEDTTGQYTKSFIDTSSAGASNTTVKMTATLLDANGGTLPAGIKVNWSTKGLDGKTFIPTDSVSGTDYTSTFTDAAGQAITYIYSWGVGDVEVFATADDIISTTAGKIHFSNRPSDARIVSATTSEGWIKAKVIDRYGNPVQGVDLTFSRISGKGYIPGRATTRANSLTDREGILEFAVTGGDAKFEVATTTDFFGQTNSQAGYVNGAFVSTSSAGGTLTPAGVGKVIVDVTSRDLIAETIAANEKANEATEKTFAASELAAKKADKALEEALKVQSKIAELAKTLAETTAQINKQLASLLKTIVQIQNRVR